MGKRAEESKAPPISVILNGWEFLTWPAFDERLVALVRALAAQHKASAQNANPRDPPSSPEATVVAALVAVLRDRIAGDPDAPNYRLRDNLGAWRRVKFLGRLRLFYRFSSAEHMVVLTWLNDENTLRKQGASTDPCVVFSGMLSRGDVPADWEALVAGAKRMSAPKTPLLRFCPGVRSWTCSPPCIQIARSTFLSRFNCAQEHWPYGIPRPWRDRWHAISSMRRFSSGVISTLKRTFPFPTPMWRDAREAAGRYVFRDRLAYTAGPSNRPGRPACTAPTSHPGSGGRSATLDLRCNVNACPNRIDA